MIKIPKALLKLYDEIEKRMLQDVDMIQFSQDYTGIRKEHLKEYSTKELMDELRRRGKTIGRKGVR